MRQINLIIILLVFFVTTKAQQNQGTVKYKTVMIDTINNIITPQDSMYMEFAFKPNKTLWETGLVNKPEVSKTILNNEDFYSLEIHQEEKTAYHGTFDNGTSFNDLLNYKDTSLHITKTTTTKVIAGRLCKKMVLKFNVPDAPNMVLWYDDAVNCSSIIPGVGMNGKSVKGLILEYEMPSPFGKNIITASSVTFGNVDNHLFIPNLSGYEITEMNPSGTCNGHH
jgi:hypothetical protein